jgi:hypothetical protein
MTASTGRGALANVTPQPVGIDKSITPKERAVVESTLAKLPLHSDNVQFLMMDMDGKLYSNHTALKAAAKVYTARPDGTMVDAGGHHYPMTRQLPRPGTEPAASAMRSVVPKDRSRKTVYTPPNNQTNSGPYHEFYGYAFDPDRGGNFNAYLGEVYLPCFAMHPDTPSGPSPLDIGYIYSGGWSGNAGAGYKPTDFGLQYSSIWNDYSVYTLVDGTVLTSGEEGPNRIMCGQWVTLEYGVYGANDTFVAILDARTRGNGIQNFAITRVLGSNSGWDYTCTDCILKQVVSIGQLNLQYNAQGQLVNTAIPYPGYFADGEYFGSPGFPIRFANAGLGVCYLDTNNTTVCGRDFSNLPYGMNSSYNNYNAINPRGRANAPDNPSIIHLGFEPTHTTGWDEQVSINVGGGPYVQSETRSVDTLPRSGPCQPDPDDTQGLCAVSHPPSDRNTWCTDYNGDTVYYTETTTVYDVYDAAGNQRQPEFYYVTSNPGTCGNNGWTGYSPAYYFGDYYLPQ